jgi:hypothetical protein
VAFWPGHGVGSDPVRRTDPEDSGTGFDGDCTISVHTHAGSGVNAVGEGGAPEVRDSVAL